MPEQVLLRRAGDLLEVEIQHIEKYLMDLAMERKIVLKEGEMIEEYTRLITITWN